MFIDEKQTVLVVDDTPENIDVLVGTLKGDYEIAVARDGIKALQIVRSNNPPDIILLDVMMPKMDGYEVCRLLKADHATRNIPIIFITAKISSQDEINGLEMGAVDYIGKPIRPHIVKARVKTHLTLVDHTKNLEAKVRQRTAELQESRLKVIQRLGRAAEYRDNETGLHVIRMCHYCRILALAAKFDQDTAEMLLNAAPMHDVGKIGIPDSILLKPGKLDKEEWIIMKTHTKIGAEIIGTDPSELLKMAKVVALTHHEKYDGSGYPKGQKGEGIPRIGRVVAIADVFDALTSVRPYKDAWTVERALELLREQSGKHFDPELIPLFIAAMPEILAIKEQFSD